MNRGAICAFAIAVITVVACSDASKVQMPPHDAGPKAVVRAFVTAISEHDISVARRLMTPEQARLVATAEDSWFENVKSITNLSIQEPRLETTTAIGERVEVPVEFDLQQRRVMSMENGHTNWGYVLTRRTKDDRWLISDQGAG